MKSAYIPKKYNYRSEYFDLNSGINFLSSQYEDLNKIDFALLGKYKDYLEKEKKFHNNADALIIINDIKKFLLEYNDALARIQWALKKARKGSYGEDKVKEIVYTFNDEWKVIENATLNVEDNKIENDFLIIDESGVSTIEVKNIGNKYEKLVIDNLGRVSRLNKFNTEIDAFDMIAQSNRHLGYLKKYIDGHFKFKVPVNTIIVMASNIRIENKSDFKIYGPNQIFKEIKKQTPILNKEQIDFVYKELLETIVPGTKYPYINYNDKLKDNYTLILKSLSELLM